MNERKWKKYRVGKHLFPTRCDLKGSPPGWKEAIVHLEQKFKVSLKDAVQDHSKGEWVFKIPIQTETQTQP